MKPSVPSEFYDETSDLYTIFLDIAKSIADSRDYVAQLMHLLPQPIKESVVWHDRLTNLWRYEYGLPLDHLPYNMVVPGTIQFPVVKNLYLSIKNAKKYLTDTQLLEYLNRIKNKSKHLETLFEMRPVINLKDSLNAEFEVEGYGIRNKKIDWFVHNRKLKILLDVKYRIKSLLLHLKQIIPRINQGVQSILPRPPDPADLFKSAEGKFKRNPPCKILQGVWIKSYIKEDENILKEYFNNDIDSKKIHFAIISNWKEDAYFLIRKKLHKNILKKAFSLRESKRFVSNEY